MEKVFVYKEMIRYRCLWQFSFQGTHVLCSGMYVKVGDCYLVATHLHPLFHGCGGHVPGFLHIPSVCFMHMVLDSDCMYFRSNLWECILIQELAFNDSSCCCCCCRYHANRMLSFYAPGSVFFPYLQKKILTSDFFDFLGEKSLDV
jgi:hypothetical protein